MREQACQNGASGASDAASGEENLVTSVFDLFKIGVGPSSSHTMGPMTAACRFVETLQRKRLFDATDHVAVDLYGSLALTGKGHATDRAVLLGLAGERPDTVDPDEAEAIVARIRETGRLALGGLREIAFDEATDLRFLQRERLPHHSNGMRFTALDRNGAALETATKITHVVLDKTGTLTMGKMSVSKADIKDGWDATSEQRRIWWTLIGLVEMNSEHPIAKAILTQCYPLWHLH